MFTEKTRKFFAISLCLLGVSLFRSPPVGFCHVDSQIKNVVVFHVMRSRLPVYETIDAEFKKTLRQKYGERVCFFEEYLDAARFPEREVQSRFFEQYRRKFGENQPDLVLALGPKVKWVLEEYGEDCLGGSPKIIIDCLGPNEELPKVFQNVLTTGLFACVDIPGTLEIALSLHPHTRTIYIAVGASKLDSHFESLALDACRKYEETIRVENLARKSMREIVQVLENAEDRGVAIMLPFTTDSQGVFLDGVEAIRKVSSRSKVPIYSIFDSQLDSGGSVGGYVLSGKSFGHEAGKMAVRILEGEETASCAPIKTGMHQYVFDWRQLKRWGIRESDLPIDSVVLFKEMSFFQHYKGQIFATVFVVLLQTILILYLIALNRKQKRLSARLMAAEDRYRTILRMERSTRLGELAGSLAHELNQPLAAVQNSVNAAMFFMNADDCKPDKMRKILQNVLDYNKRAAKIVQNMRNMLKKRKGKKGPVKIDRIAADVVEIFGSEANARRISIHEKYGRDLPCVFGDDTQLRQVLLNLIFNAAEAVSENEIENRKIFVAVQEHGDRVRVEVRDFGPGIAPELIDRIFQPFVSTKEGGMGMGLAICETIVEDHGGTLHAFNNEDRGATFAFELPVEKNEE